MRAVMLPGFLIITACRPANDARAADSTFAQVQTRGASVMGVDQYTSKHVFEDLPDGGRIVLDRDDATDSAAVRTIRVHMRDIERAFRQGNFDAPGLVHSREVPGTRTMSEKRSAITYAVEDRPRGAVLRIRTADATALRAVHDFLAFQRADHRAAGHDPH